MLLVDLQLNQKKNIASHVAEKKRDKSKIQSQTKRVRVREAKWKAIVEYSYELERTSY